MLRLECRRVDGESADYCFTARSVGVARHDAKQVIDRLDAALASNGLEESRPEVRLSSPSMRYGNVDDEPMLPFPTSEKPSVSAWHIDLVCPHGLVLAFSSQPYFSQAGPALHVEYLVDCAQAYEDVLMTFVLPFMKGGIGLTHLDWADFMTIAAGGTHAKLVATSLPASSTAEDLTAAHRQRLREASCSSVTGAFSMVFAKPSEGFRAWSVVRRGMREELPAQAICSDGVHMAADMQDFRLVSLLVWGKPYHLPAACDKPSKKPPIWRRPQARPSSGA